MRVVLKKCHTCGALGVGPHAVKLWPFENRMYCREHYREPLEWDEERSTVTDAIRTVKDFDETVASGLWRRMFRPSKVPRDWRGYIEECAGLAGWALEAGDRRTFTYYFARATYAWALSQEGP